MTSPSSPHCVVAVATFRIRTGRDTTILLPPIERLDDVIVADAGHDRRVAWRPRPECGICWGNKVIRNRRRTATKGEPGGDEGD
jgi:hypothetical protein